MFEGIKIICLGAKDKTRHWEQCLNSVIVPSEKFLKIANKAFHCPACGHRSARVKDYFSQILKLQKAVREFNAKSGFYLSEYGLFYAHEYGEDDSFDTPYFLENDDWGNWNNQISSITLTLEENPAYEFDIWEDHFYKSRPFIHPPVEGKLTFSGLLRRKVLYFFEHEVKDLHLLKDVVKETRTYNSAWVSLLGSFVGAVPVDLRHPLYLAVSKTQNLAELFPEETYS